MFREPVFSFVSTPVRVGKKNVKEVVLSIDEAIIKAGFKYQIYELFSSRLVFDNGELRLTYKEDRLNEYWSDSRGEGVYSILQIHQWGEDKQKTDSAENDYPVSLYFTYNGSSQIERYFHSKVNPMITVYSNAVVFDDKNEQNLEVIIESYSDIWYNKVYDLEGTSSFKDNSVDSMMNTPRLNSFLRDIEAELAKYDSKLVKDFDSDMYADETARNRVLIKGEVVYEDNVNN